MTRPHEDITRATLVVLFIGGLLLGTFWVLRPFLPSILWAATLVLATWPLMLWVQRHLRQSRALAVVVMTLALLLVLIVPFGLAIVTIATNYEQLGELARTVLTLRIPAPPDWLASIPIVGGQAAELWSRFAFSGIQELAPRLAPYAAGLTQWFLSAIGGVGGMLAQFLLTTAIAAVMYAGGEAAAAAVMRFGRRLAGERGEMTVRLAGQAVRSVALGVIVTAVAQTAIGALGLMIAGVPFASLLTAVIFVLCLIQLGPGLVMFPAVIWLYYAGDFVVASVLLVFTIVAVTIDQLIRPLLIRRGADLPLLLILAGVIGGLIGFGILGIFIGPTILAVAYTLANAWMAEAPEQDLPPPGAG